MSVFLLNDHFTKMKYWHIRILLQISIFYSESISFLLLTCICGAHRAQFIREMCEQALKSSVFLEKCMFP